MFKWKISNNGDYYYAEHNPSIRADLNFNVFGGGGTEIEQPSQPTVTNSISDYVANYPALFNLQQKYAPQEAAQQVALAQKYAGALGTAYKTAQEAMYPAETAITNSLNQQIQSGMSSQVPEWMRNQYQSDLNANLGTNVGSGIGADYISRGLLQQQQDWQNYYRDLGLSVTGRQPIYSANTNTANSNAITSGYTPSSVLGYNSANYGTAASLYGSTYNSSPAWMNALGTLGGAALGGWSTNWK